MLILERDIGELQKEAMHLVRKWNKQASNIAPKVGEYRPMKDDYIVMRER